MENYTYRIIIEPDEHETFHAYVPALRGCHTWGESVEKVRENIRDAIDSYLKVLISDKEEIPKDEGIEVLENFSIPIKNKSLARA